MKKALALLLFALCLFELSCPATDSGVDPNVRIYDKAKGNQRIVILKLTNVSEVTVALSAKLKNMKSSPRLLKNFDIHGVGEHVPPGLRRSTRTRGGNTPGITTTASDAG